MSQQPAQQQEEETSASPSTAVIVLGEALFFQPDSDDVLAVTVFSRSAFGTSLSSMEGGAAAAVDAAASAVQVDGSSNNETSSSPLLTAIHIVTKTSSLDSIYDPEALASHVAPRLQEGGELTVHVMPSQHGGGATVEAEDLESVRTSLVLAHLRIEAEQEGPDGSRVVMAKKVAVGAVGAENDML